MSRFVFNPGKPHLEAAKRVFLYLKKTLSLGLVYRSSPSEMPPNTLWGYIDSDWAGCPDSRRSTSGFVFMLNGAAISWRFKRQPTVALSSAEAEFISASAMVQEVIFLRKFLANLGYPQTVPTRVFANIETCIAWSEGSVAAVSAPSTLTCVFTLCTRLALLVISNSASSTAKSTNIFTKAPTPPWISVATSWATEP